MAIAAVLFFAGCARMEMNSRMAGGNSLVATIDGGVSSTKAILVDNPGVRMQSRWQGGDCIGVFGNGASNVRFNISEADISEDGRSAEFNSAAGIPSGELVSYSPYQEGAQRRPV